MTASYFDGRNSIWLLAKNMPAGLLRKYAGQILGRQANLAWTALKAWRGRKRGRGFAA